jgi:RecB family endonuclease NucS
MRDEARRVMERVERSCNIDGDVGRLRAWDVVDPVRQNINISRGMSFVTYDSDSKEPLGCVIEFQVL